MPKQIQMETINKLPVILVQDDQSEVISIQLLYRRGSVDEPPEKRGITDLINRLSQRKTEKFSSGYELMKAVESLGAKIAFVTTKEYHIAQINLTDRGTLVEGIGLLDQVVNQPVFTEDLMAQEKQLILQDRAQIKNDPRSWVSVLALEELWPDSLYGRLVMGDETTLSRISLGDLREYHRQLRQTPPIVAVAGELGFNDIRKHVIHLTRESQGDNEAIRSRVVPIAQSGVVVETRPIEQANLWIAFPTVGAEDYRYWAQSLFNYVFGVGFLSRLNYSIRTQRSLAYYYSNTYIPLKEVGVYAVVGGIPTSKLEAVFRATWEQVVDVQRNGLKPDEVERGYNYVVGYFGRMLEVNADLLAFTLKQYLRTGQIIDFEQWKNRLSQVTIDEMRALANEVINAEKVVVSVIGDVDQSTVELAWEQAIR